MVKSSPHHEIGSTRILKTLNSKVLELAVGTLNRVRIRIRSDGRKVNTDRNAGIANNSIKCLVLRKLLIDVGMTKIAIKILIPRDTHALTSEAIGLCVSVRKRMPPIPSNVTTATINSTSTQG